MEHGAKPHLKHLTEYFALLYEFAKMGEEESQFLISIHAISTMVNFYLGQKSHDYVSNTYKLIFTARNSFFSEIDCNKIEDYLTFNFINFVQNMYQKWLFEHKGK